MFPLSPSHTHTHAHTDANIKSSIAHVFHAVAMHSPDTGKNIASEFLPLVFLAMHTKASEEG